MAQRKPNSLSKLAGVAGARLLLRMGRFGAPERNRRIARLLGGLVMPFMGREIRKARDTLSRARLPLRVRSRRRFIRKVFENFGKAALDTACALYDWPGILDRILEPDNLASFRERVSAVYRRTGRLIMITCHMGNWEILGGVLSGTLPSFASVAKRVADPDYQELVEELRRRLGSQVIYQDEPLRRMMKFIRNGGVLGLLPDQDIRRNAGLFVPFLGEEAYTPAGPAVLALGTQTPILPCFMVHHGDKYRLKLGKLIVPPRRRTEETVRELTLRCQEALEKEIRLHPEQWAWFHPRYRTRPEDLE